MATREHQKFKNPGKLVCGVITVSDTRTMETDKSGAFIEKTFVDAGHDVRSRVLVPDEPDAIRSEIQKLASTKEYHIIVSTGGTGIASRDNTVDTVEPILDKKMRGFGELFRMLSYDDVGTLAMLSNATGGLIGQTLIFCIPGSLGAVTLGMEKLIMPEIGHLVWEAIR